MENRVRHVLGISGGKDSAALAIYMHDMYPELNIEYYTADTGKELKETYQLINNLEIYLGKKIIRLKAFSDSGEDPFDYKLKSLRGFLPNSVNRWCTKSLKLDVFEQFVGDDPVISYVGIRGDENREGYISTKNTIQSIFPFRKNIWSEDVVKIIFNNNAIEEVLVCAEEVIHGEKAGRFKEIIRRQVTELYTKEDKLHQLLELSVKDVNKLIYTFLKQSKRNYPIESEGYFPLLNNEDVLNLEDIFKLLQDSGVGIPAYYNEINFEINGLKSTYNRSRSGCYFCFFQQNIEWVWLYEQHPDLFAKAMEYEKDDFTWSQDEPLSELSRPERIEAIKLEYIKRQMRNKQVNSSDRLLDILVEEETEGCASCFI